MPSPTSCKIFASPSAFTNVPIPTSRALEGLELRNGVLRGALPDNVEVTENGLRFNVDVAAGQKTGFYLDQRDNRALTETLARGTRRAELLLLHRRLLAVCAARRREIGAVD